MFLLGSFHEPKWTFNNVLVNKKSFPTPASSVGKMAHQMSRQKGSIEQSAKFATEAL